MNPINLSPIGIIHSPFKEKFGIPRQPGLAPSSSAVLELIEPFNVADTVRGLDQFSHVWIIFLFHETANRGWTPTVRPPRLGGNKAVGVFATRSTHRPNPIGMSVAELKKVEIDNSSVKIHLKNIDLIDGTPVLDIKPYIPYSDSISNAYGAYADQAPETLLEVVFSKKAEDQLKPLPKLKSLITEVLSLDPRPAYKANKADEKVYGIALEDVDVKFRIEGTTAIVIEVMGK